MKKTGLLLMRVPANSIVYLETQESSLLVWAPPILSKPKKLNVFIRR